MKYWSMLLLCVFCMPCVVSAAPLDASSHPDTTGWVDLFAEDLSNAQTSEKAWRVNSSGILNATRDDAIWTQRDYDDFILDLEFKNAPDGNSGVILFCNDIPNWVPTAVEISIMDDYGEKWKDGPAYWKCGAIFGHQAPTAFVVKKPREWNRMTITCVDTKMDIVLNGVHVVDADLKAFTSSNTNPDGTEVPSWLTTALANIPTKGKIGLQGKHGGRVWFRNIKIKELKKE